MYRRTAFAFSSALALSLAGPAFAEALVIPVSIVAGPLPSCLQNLERQTGIELLYDRGLISGLESPAVHGSLTTEAALRQMLAETNLTVRRAASGAWVIEAPAAAPLAQPDAAVAEILVIGRHTQNADIRRFENDVQPYTVASREEILGAHRDNIDQYFKSRITADTTVVPPSLAQSASTISEINLRGLGSEGTVVLIDGRRMPSMPVSYAGFRQPDLNGIPLHAIERIEVLTGAAGGIYGFGALGGVVNVVLDRGSGVDLHVTQGISSRGDAHQQGVEARFGQTFNDGATDFVLFASHSEADTVLAGERGYAMRDRRWTYETIPQYFPGMYPYGNSITVRSIIRLNPETGEYELNPKLTFKPEFGGTTLSSDHTFLPTGFSGGAESLVASLTQHAGQSDLNLPDVEAQVDLGSNPRSDALLANFRHRFDAGFEAFVDALVLRSRGESRGDSLHAGLSDGDAFMSPESPANPFTDYVTVVFPIENLSDPTRSHVESTRYTAGVVAELPFDWRGTAEVSSGEFRYEIGSSAEYLSLGSLFLMGDPADLDTNPLGDWDAFQRVIGGERTRYSLSYRLRTQFRDYSLRLAGPVFSTDAGPATLTLLAERRTERVPEYNEVQIRAADGTSTTTVTPVAARSSDTTSLYAELRTRLFDEAAPAPFLRGLELQLAVRRDEEKDDFAREPREVDSDLIHAEFAGTAYTLGAKVSPTRWLMLRGSYATGEQPPPLHALVELDDEMWTAPLATDPKRDGTGIGADVAYLLKWGGYAGLKTAYARTVSIGTVLTPLGQDGPRLALDFSRIRRTRDVLSLSPEEIIAHEDFWSRRVARAPLTDADRAKGYTAGPVTMIDMRFSNEAALDVDAIDLHADWPMTFLGGRLRLYADATYHMRNVQKAPFQPDVNWAGYREGPLKRRANGGFEWSTDQLTLGANLQYYGSSLVLQQGPRAPVNDLYVEIQGSTRIPSQSYLDLHGTWRLPVQNFGPVDDLTLDLGIVNVLDKAPPRESPTINLGPAYSRYGDPRQRRFELGLSCHF